MNSRSGLIQLDRDLDPRLYAYYRSGRVTPAHLEHVERTADQIARAFPPSARILEIGGGAGHLMRALACKGFHALHVVDPSEDNQANAEWQTIRGIFPEALAKQELRFDVIVP
jgi:2-polyprenyl-3-methyl-5-hydroxy-6-metoxy-1,4-benzoquinol methylase